MIREAAPVMDPDEDTLLPSGLIHIFGPHLGCGKTAMLAYLAFLYHRAGRKVYSNFRLNLPDVVVKPSEVLLMRKLSDCFIAIDELWVILDSRQSTTGENYFLNKIILTSRKRGVTIAGTSQMPSMVDKRFRDIADVKILTELVGRQGDLESRIRYRMAEWNIEAPEMLNISEPRYFGIGQVAPLYDTSEEIESNKRLYVAEMAKAISEDEELMADLKAARTPTAQKYDLQVYAGVKRSYQDIVLEKLHEIGALR